MASTTGFPTTGTRTALHREIQKFLADNPSLHLGGEEDFHGERRDHLQVFGFHSIPEEKRHPIHEVEFTAIGGPHGTIPIRVFYPKSAPETGKGGNAALIYFHGGGYTVGSVDEFENGLRLLAEESGVQVYGIDYRLAPEFRFPTQLDEYSALIDALQGDFGASRGVAKDKVFGGGDSAGGDMTAAIALRRRDSELPNLAGQMLYYPEARLPFDTPAATENNTGLYLECDGIFSFADHYLPRGVAPGFKYFSPGMQSLEYLKGVPPARVYTSRKAGNDVQWRHYDHMTHGWLQMTAWSLEATKAVKESARDLREMAYEKS
ncbi:hypothetical protein B0A55_09308 [Friedmanniomyces simplex]|uniref:Alpha/beta hydrolase fold-3 domain-containing protein n=1 Tax=Friedmanniomyces simplex TaxID=329884 RepID=A0A4U0WVD8_9PEZI|nr:hypothetical protein B0A55_09308 [Friedmanniomyces simplex]